MQYVEVTDFGLLVYNIGIWLKDHWWNIELTYFGLTTTVGILTAWCIFGGILLHWIAVMVGDVLDG